MQIKINDKILSVPPYISTNWSNIAALHMKDDLLFVILHDDTTVSVPGLQFEMIEQIFKYHATYLESNTFETTLSEIGFHSSFPKPGDISELLEQTNLMSMQIGIGSMDGIANAMQHNPALSDAPILPQRILEKIAAVTKILKTDEIALPEAHPSCNCFHCQIARVLNPQAIEVQEIEERVSDTELKFQQWDISQTGENLFSVISRLDNKESYSVFLGQPVGCTCGNEGCDHIIAVLKS